MMDYVIQFLYKLDGPATAELLCFIKFGPVLNVQPRPKYIVKLFYCILYLVMETMSDTRLMDTEPGGESTQCVFFSPI